MPTNNEIREALILGCKNTDAEIVNQKRDQVIAALTDPPPGETPDGKQLRESLLADCRREGTPSIVALDRETILAAYGVNATEIQASREPVYDDDDPRRFEGPTVGPGSGPSGDDRATDES